MTELDELERDLEEAANVWFSPALHHKLKRVIQIARAGEKLQAGVRDATARLDGMATLATMDGFHNGPVR